MIQLAAAIDDPNRKGVKSQAFQSQVMPFPEADKTEATAKFHGYESLDAAMADWSTYPHPSRVYTAFGNFLDSFVSRYGKNKTVKLHMIGYNILNFDEPVLRHWFKCLKDNFAPGCWFWQSPIDVMALAAEHLIDRRAEMENFQLATVAETLGISVDKSQLHGALYDVALTRAVYYQIRKEKANGDQSHSVKRGEEPEREPQEGNVSGSSRKDGDGTGGVSFTDQLRAALNG